MGAGGGEEGEMRRWWEEKDKRGEVGGGSERSTFDFKDGVPRG